MPSIDASSKPEAFFLVLDLLNHKVPFELLPNCTIVKTDDEQLYHSGDFGEACAIALSSYESKLPHQEACA